MEAVDDPITEVPGAVSLDVMAMVDRKAESRRV